MKIYEWLSILTCLKCPNCGRIVSEDTTICPFCKSVIPLPDSVKLNETGASRFHIVLLVGTIGMIISLLLLFTPASSRLLSPYAMFVFFFVLFLGFISIIVAVIELIRIIQKKSSLIGIPLALFALLLGLFVLYLFLLPNIMHPASTRSKVSRAKGEMQMIATALEAYFIDNHVYPSPGRVSFREPGSYYGEGSYAKEGGIVPIALTTPAAYITVLPHDPFRRNGRGYYGYGGGPGLTGAGGKATIDDENHDYTGIWPAKGYIITSYGPDVVDGNSGNSWVPGGTTLREELCWSDDYSMDTPDFMQCDKNHPLQTSGLTYDPTNGVTSAGDVWRRGP